MATQDQGDMPHVRLERVSKQFGVVEVIRDLSLSVNAGEFCALLGPSGCGKSTLLRMIAGLETVTSGSVVISGRDVTSVPPAKRRISMVFQSYALYPHMTVRQNIAFSLDIAGASKTEMAEKTEKVARLLQLEDYLDRKPSQLSGGQRQRVAIGRALVRDPEVFLFDEPLSNLDAKLRVQMRLELAKLHQDLRSTMIYVTHDQVEAMTLADRIVVLDSGRIAQVGSPLDLYRRPENKFVASFIGSPAMNFLTVEPQEAAAGKTTVSLGGPTPMMVPLRHGARRVPDGDAFELGIRPEHAAVTEAADPAAVMTGRINMLERLGNATMLYVETERGMVVVEADSESPARIGDAVGVKLDAERAHLFAADGNVV